MGVKAAVCGLIIVTAVRLLKQMCRRKPATAKEENADGVDGETMASFADSKTTAISTSGKRVAALIAFNIVMCLGAVLAVAFFGVTAILVILIGIVAGIVFYRVNELRKEDSQEGLK